jgi:uncharacterized protein
MAMTCRDGHFSWYELITPDTAAAQVFYAGVLGWQSIDATRLGLAYTILKSGDKRVCGLLQLSKEAARQGGRPSWIGYVAVGDVSKSATRAAELGGVIQAPPREIPGTSRFAIIADPQGATLGLFKWLKQDAGTSAASSEPGRVGWHELLADDWQQAWPFYRDLLGWRTARAVAGPMGTCQQFAVDAGPIGGILTKPPIVPAPFWLYYFSTADIDAAAFRVDNGGGHVFGSPSELAKGCWGIQCCDPQGAIFGLVGHRSPSSIGKPRFNRITVFKVE